jgi:hypothetical protein
LSNRNGLSMLNCNGCRTASSPLICSSSEADKLRTIYFMTDSPITSISRFMKQWFPVSG